MQAPLVLVGTLWFLMALPREKRGSAIASLTFAELQRYDVGRIRPGTEYATRHSRQRPLALRDLAPLAASGVRSTPNT
jgi:glycerophosphoryl diester phosphodiesterase